MKRYSAPERHRDAGADGERAVEPHVGRVHLDAEVVLTVELHVEERQVEDPFQQLIPEVGHDLQVRVVLDAPDVAVIPRPRSVVDLRAVTPIVPAQHEADGRVEVPLHFARVESQLPQVVRVLDAGAERVVAIGDARRAGVEHPCGGRQVLVAPELRGCQTEVDAEPCGSRQASSPVRASRLV